jgi:hypothetical protein
MVNPVRYTLRQDKNGLVWDLLLYIPTVTALLAIASGVWFQENEYLTYLLLFMASFFCIAGASRILKTRLMLLPRSPISIDVEAGRSVTLFLRNGEQQQLLKDIKIFKDFSGKSFGMTGLDGNGRRLQFIFHKGQFALEREFRDLQNSFSK